MSGYLNESILLYINQLIDWDSYYTWRQGPGVDVEAERAALIEVLERRLDNVVHRASFANSRDQARQLVRHNHVLVNGKRVNIPSYLVRAGDVVEIKQKSKQIVPVQEAVSRAEQRGIPSWLAMETDQVKATVQELPKRSDLAIPFEEQLIVEFYSK